MIDLAIVEFLYSQFHVRRLHNHAFRDCRCNAALWLQILYSPFAGGQGSPYLLC
jgi:hypothetical protein